MPKTSLRIAPALGAFFVLALVLSACGSSSNSIPSDAVASVDGKAITKAEYQRWASVSAKAAAQGGTAAVPDPPRYANCIAALRKQSKPVKGQPAPSAATLRAQCKAQDQQLVQQTMSTLIQSAWVEGEAKEQGVSASDAEIRKQLATTKKQSFPTEAAYQKFLKQSGMTQAEVLQRVRVQLLAQKITKKVQGSSSSVSNAQIKRYYDTHRAQFGLPQRRDLELILTKSQSQAQAAKSAVQGGTSWKDAAKKYSIDPTSKANGGVLKGVAKGQQDAALDKAAFSAKKGQVVGPIKGQFGYYVVRVTNVIAPQQQSLAQASPQIKAALTQQGSQKKLATFIQDFQKRWKSKTKCRTGYVVPLCSNAPKPKTTSTAGGAVPTQPSQGGGATTSKSTK